MRTVLRNILGLAMAATIAGAPLSARGLVRQEPDEKPKPEEKKKQEPQPADKPKPKPKEEKPKHEPAPPAKQPKEEEKQKEQSRSQQRGSEQDRRTQTNVQKERGHGQKIPAEKFHANFGAQHHFRVARSGGDNRHFQYGGYMFEVVEVWPTEWSFDDECYLEEDGDDYYVVDVVHPELRVLVVVVNG